MKLNMAEEKDKNKKVEKGLDEVKGLLEKQSVNYVLAAFGLVAGLAWNEAIKSLIDAVFVINRNSITVKFIYAIAVTIVVVVITYYMNRLLAKSK